MQARPTYHPSTLLDDRTLLNKLCVSPLVLPKSAGVDVKAMKLKEGCNAMMYERMPPEGKWTFMPPSETLISVCLDKPEDVLVKLHAAELTAVSPTPNGWYAELSIGQEDRQAVDAFSNAVWSHVKKNNPDLAFVPPLHEPLPHELRHGVAGKVHAKVS
eukprot:379129-Prymnesium_polylepis.1